MDQSRINALMDQASSGDDDAFGTLASAVQDGVFRLILSQGLQWEDAMEATQEVLVRAYTGRARWREGSDAMAWLCGIAVNVVREGRRKEWRRGRLWLERNGHEFCVEAGPNGEPGQNGSDPDQLRHMMEAVIDLPPRQREAIACRYLRRMSIRETAEAMGCAEGTVKSAVWAALGRLRDVLEERQ